MTEFAPAEMTLDELRPVLVEAMLPHVPFDGWSDKAAEAAGADLGLPAGRARIVFPGGAADMVTAYIEFADARMAAALDAQNLPAMKIRDRITTAVRTRLEQATGEREAVRRAMNIFGQPQNVALSARALWSTADAMWRAAGDTATDYNHYTKRLTLGGVYASTLLIWLDDESGGLADTWAFLDRRIGNVMSFEKAKAKWLGNSDYRPSLSRFLGRLRYPVA
ncbi:COQ9 family protein [Sphingoaurantiacus capsulatus]|uniref:COQ9 family protein n=1 Tax=Sphingoaurantiacus capsulatus TaxID=1771310 RepID=A0ABV7X7N7_9SPHN